MTDIILDMMESVALAGYSGGLSSRQSEILNYILEQLKDFYIIFMSFIRVNQVFGRESKR